MLAGNVNIDIAILLQITGLDCCLLITNSYRVSGVASASHADTFVLGNAFNPIQLSSTNTQNKAENRDRKQQLAIFRCFFFFLILCVFFYPR